MRRILYLILAVFATLSIVSCRTQRVVEKQIFHDSIYITKDNVIYKFEKDSVQEKEKVHIYTKRDTILNIDSVFVVKEKFVNRWKIRTDTITKVMYISNNKTASTEKEKRGVGLLEKYTFNFWKTAKIILVLFIISIVVLRNIDKLFWLLDKFDKFIRK
jgi:lipoprotein|nr:MAG TPA: hypothetical protein [Caudoviricetes sp.]